MAQRNIRHTGTIKSWKDDRGFGFITPRGGGESVFVHIKSFNDRSIRPLENEIVTYELVFDEQDRPQAKNVDFGNAVAAIGRDSRRVEVWAALSVAIVVVLGVGVFCNFQGITLRVAGWYVAISLVTFGTYWFDKQAAQKGDWRVSERTLHLLSAAGGWPGALVAQQAFRHKVQKSEFMWVFLISVAVNVGALLWVASEYGWGK